MSKRFGRNQRRKAREALAVAENETAQLQAAIRLQRADINHQASEIRQLRARLAVHERQMKACRQVLGESIALPPIDRLVDNEEFKLAVEQGWRVARPQDFRFDPHDRGPFGAQDSAVMAFETDLIEAIEGGIELGRSTLHGSQHAYITTRQGAICYRVGLDSLAQIYEPEATARVANLLAREFTDTIRRMGPDRLRRR